MPWHWTAPMVVERTTFGKQRCKFRTLHLPDDVIRHRDVIRSEQMVPTGYTCDADGSGAATPMGSACRSSGRLRDR